MTDQDTQWHLDKRVPIALIFGLIMQAGGFGWFAATLSERVGQNTSAISGLVEADRQQRSDAQDLAIQLGRIEENTRGLRADMNRLLNIMERRIE